MSPLFSCSTGLQLLCRIFAIVNDILAESVSASKLKHPLFLQHLSNDHNGGGGGVDAATANDDDDDDGVDNDVGVGEEDAVHSDKALFYDDGDNEDRMMMMMMMMMA